MRWTPTAPYKPISAIAVENEPTPFWTGEDEVERIEAWKAAVGWTDAWGAVAPVGRLNGSSGVWVADNVLMPLCARRADTWITDCLDTYRASVGATKRLVDTYRPFAAATGLLLDDLAPHPSENEIVLEALRDHGARLTRELEAARPELVVTLGNAALRVLARVAHDKDAPTRLRVDAYAERRTVTLAGRRTPWLPLAHPAAPPEYQDAHARWREGARQ
jgi:hypothetical protein